MWPFNSLKRRPKRGDTEKRAIRQTEKANSSNGPQISLTTGTQSPNLPKQEGIRLTEHEIRQTSGEISLMVSKDDFLKLQGSHIQETNIRLRDLETRLKEFMDRIENRMAKEETLESIRREIVEGFKRQEDYFKQKAQSDLSQAREKIRSAKISMSKQRIVDLARRGLVLDNALVVTEGIVKHESTASEYLNELADLDFLEKSGHGKFHFKQEGDSKQEINS